MQQKIGYFIPLQDLISGFHCFVGLFGIAPSVLVYCYTHNRSFYLHRNVEVPN